MPLNQAAIRLEDKLLEEVESFTYLGSNVDKQGGTDADVRIRIGKVRGAFHQLNNMGDLQNCQGTLKYVS